MEPHSQLPQWLNVLLFQVPCHRKPDRCLHYKNEPLPICARCLFILLGFLLIPVFFLLPFSIPLWIGIMLPFPMLVDVYTQVKKYRISTNPIRIVTGLLSGLGCSIVVVCCVEFLIGLHVDG